LPRVAAARCRLSPDLIQLVPIIAIFAVMYFLIIRPQARERQEQEKLIASLARGDRVVTASGVHGTVANVANDTVLLEVAEKTRIVVEKSTISRRLAAPDEKQAKKQD
jgi:preprotein translocase subunit YajC